ncbi:MAG: hypothetical protein R3328_00125 [Planococcaceae bacterium]|nr:hypothetical protein [Planococcaceae bacterium]
MSRTNKTVSFNLTDEFDLKLLEHAEQVNPLSNKKRNFSKYVKRLIEEDMKGGSQQKTENHKPHVNPDKSFYTMEIKEAQGSFL